MRSQPNLSNLNRIVGLLKSIIDQENQALLDAEYKKLGDLSALKLRCAEDLESAFQEISIYATASELRRILDPLERVVEQNAKLLSAALNGAASARYRLENEAKSECRVGAYDRDSQALHVGYQGIIANKTV